MHFRHIARVLASLLRFPGNTRKTSCKNRTSSSNRLGRFVFRLPILLLAPFVLPLPASAAPHRATGELLVVSSADRVAVVDVSNNREQLVAGKIAEKAILHKGNRPATLDRFHIGEKVTVVWRDTRRGEEILSLLGPADQDVNISKRRWKIGSQPVAKHADLGKRIGTLQHHVIGPKETFLDIARDYDLGFNEIVDLYPQYDPWVPPPGLKLVIPTQWLLPDAKHRGIVVNVAELRLYAYSKSGGRHDVRTFPIGIGDLGFTSPLGNYRIGSKRVHPTWYIPKSLQAKYQRTTIPPGPDNPLGDYWMGLANTSYGIHGTDIPWAVGRLVTHGCIRMYPEDIARFYPTVKIGTPVTLVYEPIKVAELSGRVYIEVHPDIYHVRGDLAVYGRHLLSGKGIWEKVDQKKFLAAVKRRNGLPTDIGKSASDPKPPTLVSEEPSGKLP